MANNIHTPSHGEHELFEITYSSAGQHNTDGKTHFDSSSSASPSVVAQAAEMVADLAVRNSQFDMYPPGHALYEWAQRQMGRSSLMDEPQTKRRVLADPRSKPIHPSGGWRAPHRLALPITTQLATINACCPQCDATRDLRQDDNPYCTHTGCATCAGRCGAHHHRCHQATPRH